MRAYVCTHVVGSAASGGAVDAADVAALPRVAVSADATSERHSHQELEGLRRALRAAELRAARVYMARKDLEGSAGDVVASLQRVRGRQPVAHRLTACPLTSQDLSEAQALVTEAAARAAAAEDDRARVAAQNHVRTRST